MKITALALLLFLCFQFSFAQNETKPAHTSTVWTLLPSIKNDAFCLINTLIGEEFYVKYYPRIYKHYDSLFTPEVKRSLENLKQYKNKRGIILSAFLSNVFYQLPDTSLKEVVLNISDKAKMKKLLNAGNYSAYLDIRNDLITVLDFLVQNGFEASYTTNIIPLINKKISSLLPVLNKYNVIYNVEKTVGLPLATDTITFYLMRYSSPHGISINNTIFLSEVSYDITRTMQVAIHEMMHPYFNVFADDLKAAIKTLKKDSLIYTSFVNHDKSFGYNEFEAYIAEACVRALEQNISNHLGLNTDDNMHWKTEDKGMHVFGAILTYEMKSEKFQEGFNGNFSQLLLKTIKDVNELGGKYLYDQLYN